MNIEYVLLRIREEFSYQIGWIFGRRKTNGLWPFPPHFRKVILQFFLIDMVAYVQGAVMARYYEMHAHDIQRYGPFWGVGSTAVWNLCENSSDLVAWPVPQTFAFCNEYRICSITWPVPQTCMITRAFFKVCLVLIFLNTIVENPEPWNYFCVSISCSKSSPNLQHKFLDWKWPPPPSLVLFRKFIRFGSWTLPLEYYDY